MVGSFKRSRTKGLRKLQIGQQVIVLLNPERSLYRVGFLTRRRQNQFFFEPDTVNNKGSGWFSAEKLLTFRPLNVAPWSFREPGTLVLAKPRKGSDGYYSRGIIVSSPLHGDEKSSKFSKKNIHVKFEDGKVQLISTRSVSKYEALSARERDGEYEQGLVTGLVYPSNHSNSNRSFSRAQELSGQWEGLNGALKGSLQLRVGGAGDSISGRYSGSTEAWLGVHDITNPQGFHLDFTTPGWQNEEKNENTSRKAKSVLFDGVSVFGYLGKLINSLNNDL